MIGKLLNQMANPGYVGEWVMANIWDRVDDLYERVRDVALARLESGLGIDAAEKAARRELEQAVAEGTG